MAMVAKAATLMTETATAATAAAAIALVFSYCTILRVSIILGGDDEMVLRAVDEYSFLLGHLVYQSRSRERSAHQRKD